MHGANDLIIVPACLGFLFWEELAKPSYKLQLVVELAFLYHYLWDFG